MLKRLAKNMGNIKVSPAKTLSQSSYLVTGISPSTPSTPPPTAYVYPSRQIKDY